MAKTSLKLNRETLKALQPSEAVHVQGAGALPPPSVKGGGGYCDLTSACKA